MKYSAKFLAVNFPNRHSGGIMRDALRCAIRAEKAARKDSEQKFSPVKQHFPTLHQ